MDNDTLKAILLASSGLIGAVVGGCITLFSAPYIYKKQKKIDSQRSCYSALIGFKTSLPQAIYLYYETRMFAIVDECRYKFFPDDYTNKLYFNTIERLNLLIDKMNEEQKAFFETIGLVRTCCKLKDELETALQQIDNDTIVELVDFNVSFPTIELAREWRDRQKQGLHQKLSDMIVAEINPIIAEIKTQMNEGNKGFLRNIFSNKNTYTLIVGAFIGFVICFALFIFLKS